MPEAVETTGQNWTTVEKPGFFGKSRDQKFAEWNTTYGEGNWRIAWEIGSDEHGNRVTLDFYGIFNLYIAAYCEYFRNNPLEAIEITEQYSYTYDKTLIEEGKEWAFQPNALLDIPGIPNQFHHVALNIALKYLGYKFQGEVPLQVRDGKPGQPREEWPAGWRWGPGHISLHDPSLMPEGVKVEGWWDKGTIEELYQAAKVLQVRSE